MYGIPFDNPQHGRYLELVEKANQAFVEAGIPGTYLVDTFPILKYVPQWFPRADFKRKAAFEREIVEQMVNQPLDLVKMNMVIYMDFT